mgnify:CR=1 FL=1
MVILEKKFIKHIEFFCSINNIEISGIRNVASYTSCYINGDGCEYHTIRKK